MTRAAGLGTLPQELLQHIARHCERLDEQRDLVRTSRPLMHATLATAEAWRPYRQEQVGPGRGQGLQLPGALGAMAAAMGTRTAGERATLRTVFNGGVPTQSGCWEGLAREHAVALVRAEPDYYPQLPRQLRDDATVAAAALAGDATLLQHMPPAIREDAELVAGAVRARPWTLRWAHPTLLRDPNVILAALAGAEDDLVLWPDALQIDEFFAPLIGALKHDPEAVLKAVRASPRVLGKLPAQLQRDERVFLAHLHAHRGAPLCRLERDWHNAGLVAAAVASNVLYAFVIPGVCVPELLHVVRDPPRLAAAIAREPDVYPHLPDELRHTPAVALAYLRHHPEAARDLPRALKYNVGFARQAVRKNPRVYAHLPHKMRTDFETSALACERDPRLFGHVPHKTQGKPLCDAPLLRRIFVYRRDIEEPAETANLRLALLRNSPSAVLDHAEAMHYLIQVDPRAVGFASDRLRGQRKFMAAAIRRHGSCIEHASWPLLQDKAFLEPLLPILTQRWAYLSCLDISVWHDHDFVAAAAKFAPRVLELTHAFRDDDALMLRALEHNGDFLRFAPPKIVRSRRHVLAAVRNSGAALVHASATLQASWDVVLAACCENPGAMVWASTSLRGHMPLLLALLEAGLIDLFGWFAPSLHEDARVRTAYLRALEQPNARFEERGTPLAPFVCEHPALLVRLLVREPSLLLRLPMRAYNDHALIGAALKGQPRLLRYLESVVHPALHAKLLRDFVRLHPHSVMGLSTSELHNEALCGRTALAFARQLDLAHPCDTPHQLNQVALEAAAEARRMLGA